jgi:RHS repeat-associated protein
MVAVRYHRRDLAMLKDGLGSTIALANSNGIAVARMNYDAWGNFRWPMKKGHGIAPCKENDLDDVLERLEGKYIFGEANHDGHHYGRHFGKTLTPYLYTGRRFDAFSQTYNNRNRQYNPKYGRFLSSDPLGFNGELNLWSYVRNNPLRYTDPTGQISIEDLLGAGFNPDEENTLGALAALESLAREIRDVETSIQDIANLNPCDPRLKNLYIVLGNLKFAYMQKSKASRTEPGPTEAYNRQKHYGKTPTAADRKAVGAGADEVADHQPPLVDRYYEGDPSIGEPPGYTMTPAQRKASGGDRSRMAPQPKSESNAQGAEKSRYSREQKKKYGL